MYDCSAMRCCTYITGQHRRKLQAPAAAGEEAGAASVSFTTIMGQARLPPSPSATANSGLGCTGEALGKAARGMEAKSHLKAHMGVALAGTTSVDESSAGGPSIINTRTITQHRRAHMHANACSSLQPPSRRWLAVHQRTCSWGACCHCAPSALRVGCCT